MKKIVNFLNNNWREIIAYSAVILFFLILEGDYVTLKKQNEMKYKRDSVEYELMKVDYSFMTDTTSKQIDNVLIIFYNYKKLNYDKSKNLNRQRRYDCRIIRQ